MIRFRNRNTIDNENKPHYVYSLTCPIENKIKYIGMSINPKSRYYNHLSNKNLNKKRYWILYLESIGKRPIMDIIKEHPNKKEASEHELYLINSMNDLLNVRKDG